MNKKEFYTAEELALELRVNIMTIYRYIKSGKIRTYKLGKDFRISRKEYMRFLANSLIVNHENKSKKQ